MWDFKAHKNNIAVVDEHNVHLTYADLDKVCGCIAEKIGLRKLVFCFCTNTLGSLVGYTSFIQNKIVPVMLNANLEREFVDRLLINYHPSFLWLPIEKVEEFAIQKIEYEIYGYALVRTTYETIELNDELALLLTTSGSTGSPKFVRQSYKNIEANTVSIVKYLRLDESEKAITTLPMNYTYGLSIINTHLYVGATILLTEKGLMQKEFWEFFKKEQATSFGGVPYTYEMLDRLRMYRMELPSLKTMTQAGGKLTPELHEKFAKYAYETNRNFIVMYGQCEATARMAYLPADMAVRKKGSMGIAIPGGKLYLLDDNGDKIDTPFKTGELIYEGPNVTLGYAENRGDLCKGDERNGILHTGDMAQYDDEHFFYIVGRKKRFLKIYGNRINLDEIDQMIKGKFYNTDVACTGIDDHMYIFVTATELADEIRNFVISQTKLSSTAFKTICVPDIPKNDAGKILYRELSTYY